jgi:AP2-associated kinase
MSYDGSQFLNFSDFSHRMHHLRAFTNSVASAAKEWTGDFGKSAGDYIAPGRQYRIRDKTYTEEKLLSEGGFGFVYLVRELNSQQPYVVKRILCQDRERIDMAMREVDIFERLPRHANLVSYYGHTIEVDSSRSKEVIILLEYCPGGHVYDLMQRHTVEGGVPTREIIKVIRDTVSGLSALHSMDPPVQHRDLKLENILLNGSGNYVLLDFGSWSSEVVPDPSSISKSAFSKVEESIERYTTLMYRPPEMADLYKGFPIDQKVDMWMLGCILFTMLNNHHPFQDASTLAIVNCRYTMDLDHIYQKMKYPSQLVDLCYWLLAQNPADRPSSRELCEILAKDGFPESCQFQLPKSVTRGKARKQTTKNNDVWTAPPSEGESSWQAEFSSPPPPPAVELPDLLG